LNGVIIKDMSLYYLIYSSVPTRILNDTELEQLLTTSRAQNKNHLVTGMLVCLADRYLQLIEGPEEAIERLYKNIVKDPRHEQVITEKEGPISARYFPDWAMGFDKDKYALKDNSNTFHLLDDDLSKLLDILYRN
jgi:Mg2+ and Co2+ transporter CorA